MSTSTLEDHTHQNEMHSDEYWQAGRIIVHTVGNEAGLMRLDIDLEQFDTPEDVQQHVKLIIPGETSPLKPTSAVGKNGRFVISYFSSDIANAGHLPAEAVVTWQSAGSTHHSQQVRIESAENVVKSEGDEAVNIPGGDPVVIYPATVGLLSVLAIAALLAVVAVVLFMGR